MQISFVNTTCYTGKLIIKRMCSKYQEYVPLTSEQHISNIQHKKIHAEHASTLLQNAQHYYSPMWYS